mmetsp:Transcript_2406/g.6396  ORF Transcript_2406/g.6396 Transcript_2406/m.6396 type:complete len:211 (-) Transcript_2406:500-1132(-)
MAVDASRPTLPLYKRTPSGSQQRRESFAPASASPPSSSSWSTLSRVLMALGLLALMACSVLVWHSHASQHTLGPFIRRSSAHREQRQQQRQRQHNASAMFATNDAQPKQQLQHPQEPQPEESAQANSRKRSDTVSHIVLQKPDQRKQQQQQPQADTEDADEQSQPRRAVVGTMIDATVESDESAMASAVPAEKIGIRLIGSLRNAQSQRR